MAFLDLLDDVAVIHDLRLEGGGRRDEEKEVVALPRRRFGGAARVDLGRRHVVDDDLGVVSSRPIPS